MFLINALIIITHV